MEKHTSARMLSVRTHAHVHKHTHSTDSSGCGDEESLGGELSDDFLQQEAFTLCIRGYVGMSCEGTSVAFSVFLVCGCLVGEGKGSPDRPAHAREEDGLSLLDGC